ncbi:MAG TPA: YfcE family phosphodiesterase [Spirochaetota bacterium]|nr:YfcE family phosphodiesterase [Spirochaetota bacterium]
MKVLVVSDTHGNTGKLSRAIRECIPFDMLIHCGDGIKDIGSVDIPDGVIVTAVRGNTDLHSYDDFEELILENIDGQRVAVTHGHRFNVKAGTSLLYSEAKKLGAAAVFFGHTHVKQLTVGSPALFNPGSLSENSYGIVDTSEDGRWVYIHMMLK